MDAKFIIGIIIIWFQEIIRNVRFRCVLTWEELNLKVVMMELEMMVGKIMRMGGEVVWMGVQLITRIRGGHNCFSIIGSVQSIISEGD